MDEEFRQYYYRFRTLQNGKHIGLANLMFTVGLFYDLNRDGYSYRYCYPNQADAERAFETWDGEGYPSGNWLVRKGAGGDLHNPMLPPLERRDSFKGIKVIGGE